MSRVSFSTFCLTTLGCLLLAAASACSEGPDDNAGTGGTAAGGASGGAAGTGTTTTGGTTTTTQYDDPANVLYDFGTGTQTIAAAVTTDIPANDITASATLEQDTTTNAPCKAEKDLPQASLKITAPFNAYGTQRIDYQFALGGPVDYSARSLYLWIRYDDGFNPSATAPGGIIFYAKSGDAWTWGQAEWKNIELTSKGNWQQIKFDLMNPEAANSTGFDPATLMSIGFMLNTGDNAGGVAELPTTATFHIDCIGWSPNPS